MRRSGPITWFVCLALLLLCASCGASMGGSPIQPGLDAVNAELQPASAADKDASGIAPTAWCSPGYAKVNHHFNYFSSWGSVSTAGQTLSLLGGGNSTAGVCYYLRPTAAVPAWPKICWLEFHGSGTTLQARVWDCSSGATTPWQTLSMATGKSQIYWVLGRENSARQVRLELRSPLGKTNKITAIYALVD